MKNILLAVVAFIIIAGGVYYFINSQAEVDTTYQKAEPIIPEEITPKDEPVTEETPSKDETETTPTTREPITVIGQSVEGNDVKAYHFGTGDRELLLIGGIHGGYSWNTALLGFELIDWLNNSPEIIPDDVTVTIIPVLNPDGLKKITGTTERFTAKDVKGSESEKVAARFNANQVDLNRNFDCEWQASGTWQNTTVSGGSKSFSEPESQAIQNYVNKHEPSSVVVWYSAAGGVYASRCSDSTLPATLALTNRYAGASGYQAYEEFDYYEITGDMVNWFAKLEIPAISVLLTTHNETELTKNKAGIEAVLESLGR